MADKCTEESEQPAKRNKSLKYEVWNHFDRIESETKGTKRVDAICKYCHANFNGTSDQKTTHLKNHRNMSNEIGKISYISNASGEKSQL